MPTIDLAAVRADTPGSATLTHFNNAGDSLSPTPVVDAAIAYLELETRVGGYAAADQEMDELSRVYRAGAELLGCSPSEVAFCGGASEAWWRAFSGVRLEAGDTVLTGRSEYIANGIALGQAAQRGIEVVIIEDDEHGQIDVEAFAQRLDDTVKLVCLTHVPMTSGLVNPAAEIGRLTKEAGAYYLLDACQSVGQMPVNVDELQCDFLSFTGRKWVRGPRGSGLLYVRSSVMDDMVDPVFTDGRSAAWTGPLTFEYAATAQRFEFGEFSYASKRALGVAIEYALALGLDAIEDRVTHLANRLRSELPQIHGVEVYDQGLEKCGIVTFTVNGYESGAIVGALRSRNFTTGAPQAATAMLDIGAKGIEGVVRASPHYFNTDDEIDGFTTALAEVIGA